MRRQNTPSKNIDVWLKIPKIGHPFIINLLHIKDQYTLLVLSFKNIIKTTGMACRLLFLLHLLTLMESASIEIEC